jgi:molybdenum cofactor biosynthesis protein B
MTPPHDPASHRGGGASAAFALLTVSDTRTEDDDVSGATMRELVQAAGHRVAAAAIVPDEPERVRERVLAWAHDEACDAIVSSGGTGLSARDTTVEALGEIFDLTIVGFGELFRMLSYEEIGAAAMLSRAHAGVVAGTPVFLLPGSPKAVRLGLSRIVLPQIGHVLRELRRHGPRG